jgi:hypothetical protein
VHFDYSSLFSDALVENFGNPEKSENCRSRRMKTKQGVMEMSQIRFVLLDLLEVLQNV